MQLICLFLLRQIKKRKPSVKEFPDKEDTDIDADVEDELDDADSVQSSSSLILSSKSSKLQQQQQKGINQHQTLISQQTKSISQQLMTTTNLSPKLNQTLQDKTTEKTLFEAKNKLLDTKEQILNQKPRQPSNHYRNARTLNATNRVKTDINLKPVVKRAAANKASDKIAKDSAALNRSLDRSFSTSTSDSSMGKEKRKHDRSKAKNNGNVSFSLSSDDSMDSDKDKIHVAKQKRPTTNITTNARVPKSNNSPKLNTNAYKPNASNPRTGLDKHVSTSKPTAVQFSRTTSDEEEQDFGKVNLPNIPHSEEGSVSDDDGEDRPVVSFLKRRPSNTEKVPTNRKALGIDIATPITNPETKPKKANDKLNHRNALTKGLEEKENLEKSSVAATMTEEKTTTNNGYASDKVTLKNLSWPEQLARMKKARSAATRTSLDSCNSVESIEPPIVEKVEKKQTKQMTPLSNTRKLPRETSTKSKKQGNVSSNTAKTTKTGIIESSVTITNTKKTSTSGKRNNLAMVYDFDTDEPITQSPNAKKNNKNISNKEQENSLTKSLIEKGKKKEASNLPPQLEPQVEIGLSVGLNKTSTSRYKKSKDNTSKSTLAKQPPELKSNINTPPTSDILTGKKTRTSLPSATNKAFEEKKHQIAAMNKKLQSPSTPSSETTGANVKQISIMAFVKKRKEAAIAATKSPPKNVSGRNDEVKGQTGVPDCSLKKHDESQQSGDDTLATSENDDSNNKKHARNKGKQTTKEVKSKSTISEDGNKDLDGITSKTTQNGESGISKLTKSSTSTNLTESKINSPSNLNAKKDELTTPSSHGGTRRKSRSQKEAQKEYSSDKHETDIPKESKNKKVVELLSETEPKDHTTPECSKGSNTISPQIDSSTPIKIGKKKLAMAGKYEKEKNTAVSASANSGIDSANHDENHKENKNNDDQKTNTLEQRELLKQTSQELNKATSGPTNDFENMGYVSGDETTYSMTTIPNTLDKPVPAPKPKDIASEEDESTNTAGSTPATGSGSSKSKQPSQLQECNEEELPAKPLGKLKSCMYENDKSKKEELQLNAKGQGQEMQLADTIGDPYSNTCAIDKTASLQFDTAVHDSSIAQGGFVPEQHTNSSEPPTSKMDNSSSMLHRNEQQSHIDSGITHQIQTNLGSCNEMNIDMHNGSNLSASQNIQIVDPMTNLPSYNQHQDSHSNTTMATKNSGDSMGPSMGVYTPDSATNSVHSLHGSNGNSGGGMNSSYASQNSTVCSGEVGAHGSNANISAGVNTIMESPNSISSVPDMNAAPGSNSATPQHSSSMAIVANSIAPPYTDPPHMQPMATNSACNTMQQPPLQQPHGMQHHPQHASPNMPAQSPIGAPTAQSIPSQSPHSQHNMTSPHHPMTSPHPSITSPAHTLQQGQQVGLPPSNTTLTSPMGHHPHQHMTSPHPTAQPLSQQPSPHSSSLTSGGSAMAQTSPHPMTISPASHSPYPSGVGAPTPQPRTITPRGTPLPQPSPTPQQQGMILNNQQHSGTSHHPGSSSRHHAISPHISTGSAPTSQAPGGLQHHQQQQYYQQHHSSQYQASHQHQEQQRQQMHHLQNMQRHYGNSAYGYLGLAATAGAVGVGMNSHARHHHHHAAQMQAAAMAAMYPSIPPFGPTANIAAAGLSSSVTAAFQQQNSNSTSRQNPSTTQGNSNQAHHSKSSSGSSQPQQSHNHQQTHSQTPHHTNVSANNAYYPTGHMPTNSGSQASSTSSSERRSRGHKSSSSTKAAEAAAAAGSLAKLQQLTNGVDSPLVPLGAPQHPPSSQTSGHSATNPATATESNSRSNTTTPHNQPSHKSNTTASSYPHPHAAGSHQHHSLLPPSGYPASYPAAHTPAPSTPAPPVTPHHAGNSSVSRPNTPAVPTSSSRSHHHHHHSATAGTHSSTAAAVQAQLASNPVAAAATNHANAALMQQYHSQAAGHPAAAHHMNYNNLMWQAMYGAYGSTASPHVAPAGPPGQVPGGPAHPGATHPQAHMYPNPYLGYPANYR